MKSKPSLKTHPLLPESIACINTVARKGSFISSRLETLGMLVASILQKQGWNEDAGELLWLHSSFSTMEPWSSLVLKPQSGVPMSVAPNFMNGNPRLGKWLVADLGWELKSSNQLHSVPFLLLSLPLTITADWEEAAFCDVCKVIFSTIKD